MTWVEQRYTPEYAQTIAVQVAALGAHTPPDAADYLVRELQHAAMQGHIHGHEVTATIVTHWPHPSEAYDPGPDEEGES